MPCTPVPCSCVASILLIATITGSVTAAPAWKSISPRGLARGETLEFTIVGSDLESATQLHFRDRGLTAAKQDDGDFEITATDDVRLGRHWVWLETESSLLGPQAIVVTSIPRVTRTEPADTLQTAMSLSLPCVVDGQFQRAADVHWFQFSTDTLTPLTVVTNTISLGSSSQLSLTLIDESGRELSHSDGRSPEPIFHNRINAGTYYLRVVERSYNKPDLGFYRIQFRGGPVVHTVFPHAVPEEFLGPFQLYGFALGKETAANNTDSEEQVAATIHEANDDDATTGVSLAGPWRAGGTGSPTVLNIADSFQLQARVDWDPSAIREDAKQTEPTEPQDIAVPARVIGQLQRRGEVDWYRFTAKKGESISVSTRGERLGQRMDLDVALHDADGRQLKVLSDNTQPKGVPAEWNWASLDASGVWKSPANGAYLIAVRDLYGGSVFGSHRVYELVLQRAKPTFDIAVVQKGGQIGAVLRAKKEFKAPIALYRQHGFSGEVTVEAVDPPRGIEVTPLTIDAKQTSHDLTITATEDAILGLHELVLEARAEINGQQIHRSVSVPFSIGATGQQHELAILPLVVTEQGGEEE